MGHSNGCDLICHALAITLTEVASLHLVAAACEEDFTRNGLNRDIRDGQVRQVHVYTSPDDWALKYAARASRLAVGWLGLGYGLLGWPGPKAVDWPECVSTYRRPGYGHSTWFEAERFDATFNLILKNACFL